MATRPVRGFPVDMVAVVGFVVVVNIVFLVPALREATLLGASLRTAMGIPTLLFLPGYVLVSIAFPAAPAHPSEEDGPDGVPGDSIDLVERIALAFGMSVAFLPVFALALGGVWTLSASAVLTSLSVLLVGGTSLAVIRRYRLPSSARFGRTVDEWMTVTETFTLRSHRVPVQASMLVLGLALVLAVGSMGFAVATPYQSGQSSTFYLATENETGTPLASDYPTNATVDTAESLTVGITNDEERRQPYTVVATLERVETGDSTTQVTEMQELIRLSPVVDPDETWTGRHTVEPELVGDNLRLHYYLYNGATAPATPDSATAYRDVYIWIDVSGA